MRVLALVALIVTAVPATGSAQDVQDDVNGQPVWTRQFGTPGHDDALGLTVNAQGVYFAGNTRGALPGQEHHGSVDAFVIELR